MSKNIIDLNDDTFENEVKGTSGTVLVDFWAPWCTPCSMFAPVLEKIAEEFTGKLKVCKLNVDDNNKLASQFGVMSIPTLIMFKGGEEIDRVTGALGGAQLSKRIKEKIG